MLLILLLQLYLQEDLYQVDNLSDIIETDLQIFVLSITLLFPIFNFFLLHDVITRQFSFKNHQEDLHLGLFVILLTLFFYFFVIPTKDLLMYFCNYFINFHIRNNNLFIKFRFIFIFYIINNCWRIFNIHIFGF